MLTPDFKIYMKEKWHGHSIIYVRFANSDFLFRTLNKKEYKYIKAKSRNQKELEDNICNASCLYPEEYDFGFCPFGGLPEYISQIIEQESGFKDIQKILNAYREEKENTTLEQQCMDMIKAFIPEYTYEEMEDWTWERLMKMTARAERVANLRAKCVEGKTFELNDKSEEVEKEYEAMNSENKEFVKMLYEKGIDPMGYFNSELQFENKLLDFPLIMGTSFDNEVVLNAVRQQIAKKRNRSTSC